MCDTRKNPGCESLRIRGRVGILGLLVKTEYFFISLTTFSIHQGYIVQIPVLRNSFTHPALTHSEIAC